METSYEYQPGPKRNHSYGSFLGKLALTVCAGVATTASIGTYNKLARFEINGARIEALEADRIEIRAQLAEIRTLVVEVYRTLAAKR